MFASGCCKFSLAPEEVQTLCDRRGVTGKTEGNPIVLLLSLAVCRTMNVMKTDGVLLEFRV